MPTNSKFITFVLGAGSSFEVSMPTGGELKNKIASSLAFKVDHFGRLMGGDDQLRAAMSTLGQESDAIASVNDYYGAAKLIRDGMPQAPSIDNFIDSHRSNKQVAEIGKIAIASEILKAERKSKLYVNPTNAYNKPDFSQLSDTWFNEFFQLICLGHHQIRWVAICRQPLLA